MLGCRTEPGRHQQGSELVAVECAQPPRHRWPSAAAGFQFPGEALDVCPSGVERADRCCCTSWRTGAGLGRSVAGQAGVTGQEPSES